MKAVSRKQAGLKNLKLNWINNIKFKINIFTHHFCDCCKMTFIFNFSTYDNYYLVTYNDSISILYYWIFRCLYCFLNCYRIKSSFLLALTMFKLAFILWLISFISFIYFIIVYLSSEKGYNCSILDINFFVSSFDFSWANSPYYFKNYK